MISFFSVSIERIGICLEGLKSNDAFRKLSYVVLVGGFSSSPLAQSIVKSKFHGDSCAVISALRPDVAIVRGAVLFANNTVVWSNTMQTIRSMFNTTPSTRLKKGKTRSAEFPCSLATLMLVMTYQRMVNASLRGTRPYSPARHRSLWTFSPATYGISGYLTSMITSSWAT